jgi:hypothetical protein
MNEMERAIRSCENKIAEYESHLAKPHHYHRQCRRSIQLEQVKIAALRSEAEREKGCKYCNDVCALDWQYGLDHILPDYRFCPMCGCELVKRLEVEP